MTSPIRACASLLLFSSVLAAGCSDDADGGAQPGGSTDASTGVLEDSAGDGSSSGGETGPSGEIAGRILWLDGSETELELDATYDRLELGDDIQHTCGGTDLAEGFTLAIRWPEGIAAGTDSVSLGDGPMIIAAWPQVDGGGIRATSVGMGEVTFDEIGSEPGDVVEGTAAAVLSPEEDDPDDRVREIVDIAFRCVVE